MGAGLSMSALCLGENREWSRECAKAMFIFGGVISIPPSKPTVPKNACNWVYLPNHLSTINHHKTSLKQTAGSHPGKELAL